MATLTHWNSMPSTQHGAALVLAMKNREEREETMSKEVRITLTDAQKAKIKAATGKEMGEIRVSSLGKNVAVTPSPKATSIGSNDLSVNDLSTNDMSVNDLSVNDLSTNDLSVNDLSTNDLSVNDLSTNDMSVNDLSVNDLSTNDMSVNDLSVN